MSRFLYVEVTFLSFLAAACSEPAPAADGTTIGGSNGNAAGTSGAESGGQIASNGGAGSGGGAGASGAGAGEAAVAGAASGGVSNGGGGQSTTGGAGAAGTAGSSGGGPPEAGCDFALLNAATPPQQLALTGSLGTHDPVVIEASGAFYMFHTGANIAAKTSTDLRAWKNAPTVLSAATRPAWLKEKVPEVETNLWAPDISYFGGEYHLYYSASSFGKNRSCIGHLSRASLSSGSWTDRGPAICSNTEGVSENFNAIDPNVVVDEAGTPWLAFGSFWSGIKLIQLDQKGDRVGTTIDSIASRPSAGGALEAPFIVRRCGYYYLFTSWDKCCSGVNSTYNIRVGRSQSVKGPYVDRDGKQLLQGGGSLVLQGDTRYHGPGHNAVLFTATAAYNVYHAYDANQNGASVLRIAELAFDTDGWPVSAGP